MTIGPRGVMTCDQWAAHVQHIASDLAQHAGTATPVVRIRRIDSFHTRRSSQPQNWVVYAPRERMSDARLRGSLAHELQHVRYDDVVRVTGRTRRALLVAFVITVLWAATCVAMFPFRVIKLHPLVGVVTVLVVTLAFCLCVPRLVAFAFRRADGLTQPVVELRNDLAAADLVGIADATASLRVYLAREQRHRLLARIPDRWFSALQTHPDTQLRITAVEEREAGEDPLAAAQRYLVAGSS